MSNLCHLYHTVSYKDRDDIPIQKTFFFYKKLVLNEGQHVENIKYIHDVF